MAATGIQRPSSASGAYPFHQGFLPSPAVSPSYSRPSSAASQHEGFSSFRKTAVPHSTGPLAINNLNASNHGMRPAAARHTTSTQHLRHKSQEHTEYTESGAKPLQESAAAAAQTPALLLASGALSPPSQPIPIFATQTTIKASDADLQIERASPLASPEPEKWETDLLPPPSPEQESWPTMRRGSADRPRTPSRQPMRVPVTAESSMSLADGDRDRPPATLKHRLRRALSFSSSTNLAQLAQADGQPTTAQRSLFRSKQGTRSTDNLSVTSTASSASIMLRKMSQSIGRRTRQTWSGIFGSNGRRRADTPDPFSRRPRAESEVSYAHAEAFEEDRSHGMREGLERVRSPAEDTLASTLNQASPAKQHGLRRDPRRAVPVTSAQDNVDGHGSIEFPRLSQEIVEDESLSRRSSMHLDRALPEEDLASLPIPQPGFAQHGRSRSSVSLDQPASSPRSLLPPVTTKQPGRSILKRRPVAPALERSNMTAPGSVSGATFGTRPSLAVPTTTMDGTTDRADFEVALMAISADAFQLDFDLHASSKQAQASDLKQSPPEGVLGEQISSTPTLVPSEAAGDNTNVPVKKGQLQFSPRIAIHDTYHATEYDRRGEIATCNRLTPLLAQRIKEELNSYKMDEMLVAEDSRMYTHFFT